MFKFISELETFPLNVRRTKINPILAHQESTPLLSQELVPLMRLQGKLKRICGLSVNEELKETFLKKDATENGFPLTASFSFS